MSEPTDIKGRFSGIKDADTNSDTNSPEGIDLTTSLYDFVVVDGLRWNKLYPYQLIVVEKNATGDGWKKADINWQFTLPIPPQSIDIEMPFAITTSATLGGVIEEHNGAPFRMISFSGTTGVLPLKGAPDVVGEFNIAQAIFAGTISAASTLVSDLTRSGVAVNNNTNVVPETTFESPTSDPASISKTSGYFQYHQLRQFLELYAQQKKTKDGAKLRLAFCMWKDKSVYLVTPVNFRVNRGADSPYEYRYQLAFKAWARINLDAVFEVTEYIPASRNPNVLASILNTVAGVRGALENSRKVLEAIRADIETTLFTPLREVALCLKALIGVSETLGDLPDNIKNDAKESFLTYFPTDNSSNNSTGITGMLKDLLNDIDKDNASKSISKPSAILDKTSQSLINKISDLSVVSGKAAAGAGRFSYTDAALNSGHPANKIFSNPTDYYEIFSKIQTSGIKLPPAVQRKIINEKKRVRSFTRKDFEIKRDAIKSVLTDFCDSVGLGDTTFNSTFNITERGSATSKTATEDDFDIIFNLNNAVAVLNKLCVSNRMDPDKTDAVEYIAGLAKKSGIAFNVPRSKYLVPMPYAHTLEQVAALYLGNANRWHEIATLNGLREPYIDEVGFDLLLATNGSSNSIQVTDVSNLYVGQYVYISSSTVVPERRRITGIDKISGPVNIVNLSGEADLDKFTLATESKIHAYLPDTVNSQMSIYLPSDRDAHDEDFQVKAIPGVDYYDNLVRVGGISLLLSQNNDIIFATDGSTRLAVGLNNIIQKARIALSTPKGALLQHPNYGLPVKPGVSTADVSAKDILRSVQEMFSKDPSFSSVVAASIQKSGPTSKITINVGLTGTSQVIPISAEIRR